MSWELGVKAMALYRDGSKASQPLSSSSDDGEYDEEEVEVTQMKRRRGHRSTSRWMCTMWAR